METFARAIGPAPAEFAPLVALGAAPHRVSVEAASAHLHISHRALTRHLHWAGYPPARMVLAWGGFIRVLAAYGHQGLTLVKAARPSRFSDSYEVSHRLVSYAGMRPRIWRCAGADMAALCYALVCTWRLGRAAA